MSKIRNTVKKVLSIALVAMMSVSLFGCNFFFGNSGSSTSTSSSSSSKKPGITISGDSSSIGIGNQNAFDKNDFLTFPASFAEDDDDYKNVGGYDIIIQAGQSNAEGNGWGYLETPFEPNDNILYFADSFQLGGSINDKFSVMPAQEKRSNATGNLKNEFALSFAQEYLYSDLYYQGRKILIVRAAIGGTGFCVKQWGIGMQLYEKLLEMTEYALNLDGDNRIVAFLWHQGERDSVEEDAYKNYKALLTAQTADFRARYGEEIPFIAADFVNDWKSKYFEQCERVVQITREITKEIGNAGFVETSDLKSNHQQNGEECTDDIHFSRESLQILGRRYFDAFQKIKNNK